MKKVIMLFVLMFLLTGCNIMGISVVRIKTDNIDNILKYNFNLVLAGHSHNGQVRFPYSNPLVKPDNAKKYYNEYYKISDTNLYISGGIGNSVLNFRLFNRPSFNLYRLVDK